MPLDQCIVEAVRGRRGSVGRWPADPGFSRRRVVHRGHAVREDSHALAVRSRRPTPDCQAQSAAASALRRTSVYSAMPGAVPAVEGASEQSKIVSFRGDGRTLFLRPEPRLPRGLHLRISVSGDRRRPFVPRHTSESHCGGRDSHRGDSAGLARRRRLVRATTPKGQRPEPPPKKETAGPCATRAGESCSATSEARAVAANTCSERGGERSGRSRGMHGREARS